MTAAVGSEHRPKRGFFHFRERGGGRMRRFVAGRTKAAGVNPVHTSSDGVRRLPIVEVHFSSVTRVGHRRQWAFASAVLAMLAAGVFAGVLLAAVQRLVGPHARALVVMKVLPLIAVYHMWIASRHFTAELRESPPVALASP